MMRRIHCEGTSSAVWIALINKLWRMVYGHRLAVYNVWSIYTISSTLTFPSLVPVLFQIPPCISLSLSSFSHLSLTLLLTPPFNPLPQI